MHSEEYTFSGRIRPKESEPDLLGMVELPNKKKAFIYQRLSTHEQVRKSIYSLQMQDALEDLAREDGYKAPLTTEEVEAIRSRSDYPSYYANGQLHVEQRDLGISGTVGQEKREGLATLIRMIEADVVESVYVVHISRLFRDQTLIDGLSFGELCKEHNVIIVMPNMRLNLRDRMHMKIYRMELERAADELELMQLRLMGAKHFKGKQGYYCGGNIPLGYTLDVDKESKTYQKYKPYAPHAKIVNLIMEQMLAGNGSPRFVLNHFLKNSTYVPFFDEEVAAIMDGRHAFVNTAKCSAGWIVGEGLIRSVATNPVYIGWWIYGGEVCQYDNHPAIVDKDLFWAVQKVISSSKPKPRGGISGTPYPLLQGLLYCQDHDDGLHYVTSSYNRGREHRLYRCNTEYRRGLKANTCFNVSEYILEDPVCEFVVAQCSYAEYTDQVLQHLAEEYDEAKERTEALRREYSRLAREIENLKANLALTKTTEQVQMILDMVDRRMKERERLGLMEAQPIGRVLTESDVNNVRSLLSNLGEVWNKYPRKLKNEFLSLVLDKVIVSHRDDKILARIVWATEYEQAILIHVPFTTAGRKEYSEEEKDILREYYPTMPKERLMELLPGRSWISIKNYASGKLNLRRHAGKPGGVKGSKIRRWTEEEDGIVRQYYNAEITKEEMMSKLDRTSGAIISHATIALGLKWKPRNEYRSQVRWEEIGGDSLFDILGHRDYDGSSPATLDIVRHGEHNGDELPPPTDSRCS